MKKTSFSIVVITILIFVFSFSYPLNGKEENKSLIKRPDPPTETKNLSREELQTKRLRLLEAKNRKQALHEKFATGAKRITAGDKKAVDIEMDTSYTYWQNGLGDVYMTALCYNAGSSYAAMVEAEVSFYDINQNYLGYDTGYVYGGTYNVQYGSSGYCTNELAPGEYGFFWVWPLVSYSDAYYYSVNFTAEDSTTYPWSYATLDFYPSVYGTDYLGYLNFYGDIKNYSSNYVTYFTSVHFAVFNSDDSKVVDVDYSYVDGSQYGISSTAIYPGTYEPFDVYFLFAEYNQVSNSYLSAFEWYEAYWGSMPEVDPPFGSFDTPVNGANVASSIAVTGWALDDSGVQSVKIYRGSGSTLYYVGDATMVEGARPDVAATYPGYPNNTKAGWGYMMLTNFLPNGGNGTYTLHAVATDIYGKSTTLGSKTIYCDNANAVKPFGAIDAPSQGGTASGSSFVNWGWALTPQPKHIPTDGSTLKVFVDGAYVGNPHYNIYRSDIANLFPTYANSNGAIGYFYLDTTAYADGVHTIHWTARDNEGKTDGIGSRYFTIDNTNSPASSVQFSKSKPGIKLKSVSDLNNLSIDYGMAVKMKRGLDDNSEQQMITADDKGVNHIVMNELERLEISLTDRPDRSGYLYSGYVVAGERLYPLPVGSTLDQQRGIFSWYAGPGFLGQHHLVFVEKGPEGDMNKTDIVVKIVPKKYTQTE